MASITETCCCGATVTYVGAWCESIALRFREAHAPCRERRAVPKPSPSPTPGRTSR